MRTVGFVTRVGVALVAVGCATSTTTTPSTATPAPLLPLGGVHVVADRLVRADGAPVQLGGVGWSGTEYQCLTGRGIFAGPAGPNAISAMAGWHVDAVRLPLNEDCWLGINRLPQSSSGVAYRSAIAAVVRQLEGRGIVVDLDLHWSAPGSQLATGQKEMADVDHSLEFWREVASAYRNDPQVMFELYNEPHGVTWQCWRDGCLVPARGTTAAYQAVGMQQLVSAVRATNARNPLVLDGLAHATDFSAWRQYVPDDPEHAVVAAWHLYGPSDCHRSCWDRAISDLHGVPLLVTEFGDRACQSAFVDDFMSWLDQRGIGYLAWAWNIWPGCQGPSLLETYAGVPHGAYGAAVMHHLQARFPAT